MVAQGSTTNYPSYVTNGRILFIVFTLNSGTTSDNSFKSTEFNEKKSVRRDVQRTTAAWGRIGVRVLGVATNVGLL